jgi:hypothetical protein
MQLSHSLSRHALAFYLECLGYELDQRLEIMMHFSPSLPLSSLYIAYVLCVTHSSQMHRYLVCHVRTIESLGAPAYKMRGV